MTASEFVLAEQTNEEGTERIEVGPAPGEDAGVELRLLSWGQGVGWYVQKRIRLDREQARFAAKMLGMCGALAQRRPKSFGPELRPARGKRPGSSSGAVLPFDAGCRPKKRAAG